MEDSRSRWQRYFRRERKHPFRAFTRWFTPENIIKRTTSLQSTEKHSQDVCNVPTRFSSSYFYALITLKRKRLTKTPLRHAQKTLDTADIVREAWLRQPSAGRDQRGVQRLLAEQTDTRDQQENRQNRET